MNIHLYIGRRWNNFMGLIRIKQDLVFLKKLLIFFALVFLVVAGADYYLTFQKKGYFAFVFKDDPLGVIEAISEGVTSEAEKKEFKELRDNFIDSWKALELSKIRVVMYLVCSSVLVAFAMLLPKLMHEPYIITENRNAEENYER
jgi:hypothetical protein